MMKRRLSFLLCALVCAAVGGALIARPARPSVTPLRFSFTAGQTLTYALYFSGNQLATTAPRSAARSLENTLSVDLDLIFSVRRVAVDPGDESGHLLALSVGEIRDWQQTLFGARVISSVEQARPFLKDAQAFISIDDSGRILALHYPAAASPLFRSFIQTALTEVQIVLGRGPTWTSVEDSPSARVAASYQIRRESSADATAPIVLDKQFIRVEALHAWRASTELSSRVEGSVEARLQPNGYLAAVHGTRRLRAHDREGAELLSSETTFRLLRVRDQPDTTPTPTPTPALIDLVRMAPGDAIHAQHSEHDALARRTAGLTRQGLVDGVRARAERRDPDQSAWLWRAVGQIRLDESVVDELEALFDDSTLGPHGRALVIDLLASAATLRAQAGMRHLIERAQAANAADAPRLLNHVALVTRPTPGTVTWVAERYRTTQGPEHWAAALVLGALARQLRQANDAAGARPIVEELGAELARATAHEQREALVLALGNTAAPEALSSIMPQTQAADASLRKSAVAALRRIESPATRQRLFELAADRVASVQREAIRVLGGYALTASDLDQLKTMIADHQIRGAAFGEVLNVVSLLEHKYPQQVLAIADELARQPIDGQVSSRTRELQARGAGRLYP